MQYLFSSVLLKAVHHKKSQNEIFIISRREICRARSFTRSDGGRGAVTVSFQEKTSPYLICLCNTSDAVLCEEDGQSQHVLTAYEHSMWNIYKITTLMLVLFLKPHFTAKSFHFENRSFVHVVRKDTQKSALGPVLISSSPQESWSQLGVVCSVVSWPQIFCLIGTLYADCFFSAFC